MRSRHFHDHDSDNESDGDGRAAPGGCPHHPRSASAPKHRHQRTSPSSSSLLLLLLLSLLSCGASSVSAAAAMRSHIFLAAQNSDNGTRATDNGGGDTIASTDDPCAAENSDEYDRALHIAALFIIMFFSFAGTVAPILMRTIKVFGDAHGLPFQCGKLFGAGVILATAWVHMFSPADQALTNPCLPELFTKTYTSWAGALALLAALSTHLIQFFASRAIRRQLGHTHGTSAGPVHLANSDCVVVINDVNDHNDNNNNYNNNHGCRTGPASSSSSTLDDATSSINTPHDKKQLSRNLLLLSAAEDADHLNHSRDSTTVTSRNSGGHSGGPATLHMRPVTPTSAIRVEDHTTGDEHGHHLILLKEKHIATYILEMGIAVHSIIIGLTLGVARGSEFKSLIVALTFHQFFEGLALSTVVLESDFRRNFVTLAMILFYSLTTPVGIAIGIGISSAYNGNGQTALLTQGILDSLSAGILSYDALVNIIFMHFSAPALMKQPDWQHMVQLFCLWFGAAVMALIGRWA